MSKTNIELIAVVLGQDVSELTKFLETNIDLKYYVKVMDAARTDERERIRGILSKNFNTCIIHEGATYVRDAILRTLKEIK